MDDDVAEAELPSCGAVGVVAELALRVHRSFPRDAVWRPCPEECLMGPRFSSPYRPNHGSVGCYRTDRLSPVSHHFKHRLPLTRSEEESWRLKWGFGSEGAGAGVFRDVTLRVAGRRHRRLILAPVGGRTMVRRLRNSATPRVSSTSRFLPTRVLNRTLGFVFRLILDLAVGRFAAYRNRLHSRLAAFAVKFSCQEAER